MVEDAAKLPLYYFFFLGTPLDLTEFTTMEQVWGLLRLTKIIQFLRARANIHTVMY